MSDSVEDEVDGTVFSRFTVPELLRGLSGTSSVCDTEADDFFVREPQLDEDLIKPQQNSPLNVSDHGLSPGVSANSINGQDIRDGSGISENEAEHIDLTEANQTNGSKLSLNVSDSRSKRQTHVSTENMEEESSPVFDNAANVNDVSAEQSACKRRMLTAWGCFKKIIFPVAGMILYGWDIVTDIKMAISYKESDDSDLFHYTVFALVCPACFIMVMDIGWLLIDYRYTKKARELGSPNVEIELKTKNGSTASNAEFLNIGQLMESGDRALSTTQENGRLDDTTTTPTDGESLLRKDSYQPTDSGDASGKDDRFENETSEGKIWHVIWHRIPNVFKLVLRIIFTVITIGVGGMLCRTFQYTYYFIKSVLTRSHARHTFYKKRARHLQRDCFMMSFTEAFLESAPQLALQLYITYAFDRNFTPLRVQNLVTSALSITWSYSAYYRSNRANLKNTEDVQLIPFLIYLVSVASCIVPRFISFVFFAVYFKTVGLITVLGIFGIHVVVGFIVIALIVKPELKGTAEHPMFRWLYYAFFAYVKFFLFLNLEHHALSQADKEEEKTIRRNWFEGKKTRTRMLLLYALIHLENLILATILVSCRLDLMADGFFVLIVVIIGALVQLICLSSYYFCFHRNRPGKCVGCLKSSSCPCHCLNNLF
ncbi:XK-related protein 6-like [Mya arenaria]|uniref:XK-related protein 6-like n=1 Tax=Mya arenaria TaxID=6604 RepID=UPI0022E6E6E5|nr:XK-related protein 6-like [Mya arenaria]